MTTETLAKEVPAKSPKNAVLLRRDGWRWIFPLFVHLKEVASYAAHAPGTGTD
jgi:hypothetical protein